MTKISCYNPKAPAKPEPPAKPCHCKTCGTRLKTNRMLYPVNLAYCDTCPESNQCKVMTPFENTVLGYETFGIPMA